MGSKATHRLDRERRIGQLLYPTLFETTTEGLAGHEQ